MRTNKNPLVEAMQVVLLLAAVYLFFVGTSFFPTGSDIAMPFTATATVFAAIGAYAGWLPTLFFLLSATFGKYDKGANLFRAVVFLIYIAVSYYMSPMATNYGAITRPLLLSQAYLLFMVLMIWQLPREVPWKPYLSIS